MNTTSKTGEARKNRVFLIDDHPLVREGLVNLINSQRDLVVCGEAEDSGWSDDGNRQDATRCRSCGYFAEE